jgi:hypothetical protein
VRFRAKARERLKKLLLQDRSLGNDMQTKYNLFESAWNLQQGRLEKRTRAEIIKDAGDLAANGHQLPTERQLAITGQFLGEMIDSTSIDRFLDSFWPEPRDGVWDVHAPKMGHLIAECQKDPELLSLFKDTLADAFLSSNFLKLVSDVSSPAISSQLRSTLAALLTKYWKAEEDDKLSEIAAECLDLVTTAARGLHVLLSPIPGQYGTSKDDVNYLYPNDAKQRLNSMVKVSPKYGNRLCNELSRNEHWAKLLHEYRLVLGAEEACAAEIKNMADRAASISNDLVQAGEDSAKQAPAFEELALFLDEYCKSLPAWKKNLRTGCTEHIDKLVGGNVQALVNFELSKPSSLPNLKTLETLKAVSKMIGLGHLEQVISNAVQHRLENSATMRLSAIVDRGRLAAQDIAELVQAWRSAKNSEGLHGQARDTFLDARPLLLQYLASEMQKPGVSRESMAEAFELSKLFQTEAILQNMDEAIAANDKKSMNSVHVWVHQGLQLKDALAQEEVPSLSKSLMTMQSTIHHFKAAEKHLNFEPATQSVMNEVTAYIAGLADLAKEKIVRLGMQEFRSSGQAFANMIDEFKLIVGLHPKKDGTFWHVGLPAEATEDPTSWLLCRWPLAPTSHTLEHVHLKCPHTLGPSMAIELKSFVLQDRQCLPLVVL